MELLPIQTPILHSGDSLLDHLSDLQDGDIVVISSKAIATTEGRIIDLSTVQVTEDAEKLSEIHGRSPVFRQAVINEKEHMNGRILPSCPEAVMTELRPDGFPTGVLLVPNAGLDESNIADGYAVGWPEDPVKSARDLWTGLKDQVSKVAVIITDSGCRPRRLGLTAFALTVAGMDPIVSKQGAKDLYGRELKITQEAVADQLATAANFLMGNADQATPIVIVRNHKLPFSDFNGWVPGIDPEEDLFRGSI